MQPSPETMMAIPGVAGKNNLVTGASSGLGAHFAHLFAQQGSHVIAAARRLIKIQDLCGEINAAGGQATALELDVSTPDDVHDKLAKQPLDIVINNAGVTESKSVLDHRADDIDQIIDTNLMGVFHVAQAAAKGMKARGRQGTS